ncbi:putative sulfotransferase 1 family member D1-like isoform X1 [Apostichopus japonicus]|uniref:Putative sulfotransferase 1 family member D1-like isoform X1 n=1 Tax=Stichopus japonicus TaxID=307972 RepID=A0A2G8K1Q8_STIJA|nr:putative sulfotransferase 1 family member D1-like isoform X1 [Apostichopus japonicus]
METLTPFLVYKGRYHVPAEFTTKEFIEEFENMEVRNDDIFVAIYPKSGTHWMQEIVHLIIADGHSEKLDVTHRRIVAELADVKSPEMTATVGPTLRNIKDSPSPRVITTHLPCELLPKQSREKKNKVIYVLRHPTDVYVSYYNFVLQYSEMIRGTPIPHTQEMFDAFFDDLIGGRAEYGDWFDNVIGYYEHRHDDNFLFVHFESMKSDLEKVVRKVSSFIGRELDNTAVKRVVESASIQVMRASFQKDHEQNLTEGKEAVDLNIFVKSGKLNQWKYSFSSEQNERFDNFYREKMMNCDLTTRYVVS